ncbi:hypothetical protein PMZ80_002640 [Knufia obscura]|uniref:DUF1770-domain-containing protein n=2 Tax=Knufia TaxID=430999 RepID=A0AAN8EST4_9EURO|nr:hypothetical protein PMZ80_002640 [Knufia obscura]KAK5951418.1 hypothetical protein OHC33_007474 [Knufia fluminis]
MATELASALQSAHIEHNPSVAHDVNPSTAASEKIPAEIVSEDHEHDDLDDTSSHTSDTSTIPSDIIRPRPRQPPGRQRMPLPDLRFEQTYLASIKNADTTGKVIYITIRDQVLMPLVQGVGYHLLISGWRYLNRGTKFSGQTVGARVRKWWWGVNNWKLPSESERKAESAKEYFVGTFGSAQGD